VAKGGKDSKSESSGICGSIVVPSIFEDRVDRYADQCRVGQL